MLRRLIEVALPLKEVSEQSAREKSIRHGHISTLHIWWARRPLAACRAAVFASLIPDPDDPDCPPHFVALIQELLGPGDYKERFVPKGMDGTPIEDTPRNRCLEFIKHLVKWENSNNSEYIEPARKLIAAAHRFLHPDTDGDAPQVLDPFAGGGSIPLEALRLGCEAHAVDLNPVAHLIELCTLVYPQKYGQPDSRPIPDYIKRLIAHNKAKKKAKLPGKELFGGSEPGLSPVCEDIIPDVEITEAEYRKNPLAAGVKYWGHWALERVRQGLRAVYIDPSQHGYPIAYLWSRVVLCPNPSCKQPIPLVTSQWLYDKPNRKVAVQLLKAHSKTGPHFRVVDDKNITFDPDQGTVQRGTACCPFCGQTVPAGYIQKEAGEGRLVHSLMAVVERSPSGSGKVFRDPTDQDADRYQQAARSLSALQESLGTNIVPSERITDRQPRLMWVTTYGLNTWDKLFNSRQLLAMCSLAEAIKSAAAKMATVHDTDYQTAVASYLGLALGRMADYNSTLCRWAEDFVGNTFGRQGLPMVWNYCEAVPIGDTAGNWSGAVDWECRVISELSPTSPTPGMVERGSATRLPFEDDSIQGVITDPPYYDAVPYADLSDYFYVWHKRALGAIHPDLYRTPVTPKQQELIEERPHTSLKKRKDRNFYEKGMADAFAEAQRVLCQSGVSCVMFAHKSTTAWETLINALLKSGLFVTASWPFHTERPGRLIARGTAALASSVTLVCRKRFERAGNGLWDDVRQELRVVTQERLDFFWKQGIRGADFFISAIGPALSVFGKYEKVTKLSGEEVTVGQFLDEVRGLVTGYALAKILKTTHIGTLDPESRFYVVWKWSYADAKVPADESFKLSQALGIDTERLWDKTGVLEKSSENVQATPVAKRIKVKNLGEPAADGAPASVIDALHRMCAFRDKGDTAGMSEYLARSGHATNHSLWLIAQAVSEILPDGDKEKQLMQGLLNQKEGLEEAAREKRLF